MRRLVTCLLLLLATLIPIACSPQILSISGPQPVKVAPDAVFDGSALPREVNVTYTNGKTGVAQVVWKTEFPVEVTEDMELVGQVQGTGLTVSLWLLVDEQLDEWVDPPVPQLTSEELASSDLKALMMRYALRDRENSETALSWSPDGSTLAYLTSQSMYLWQLGEPKPMKLEAIGDAGIGGLNHPTWSSDGQYLAVQINMTWEGFLLILDPFRSELLYRLHTYGLGFWEPESHRMLITCNSSVPPALTKLNFDCTTDLVLFDVDNGKQQVLLKADSETLYSAAGWTGPGQALYNCRRDESLEESLELDVGK